MTDLLNGSGRKAAPLDGGIEVPHTAPVFDAASITMQRRMRFNPLRMLDPENLSQALDQFDTGMLGRAALLWDAMIRRDDTLSFVVPQFENGISGKPWGVFKRKNADEKEAARHAAALEYFIANLTASDAFDRNIRGGRHLLLKQMGSSYAMRYAAHHFIWQRKPGEMIPVEGAAPVPAITAELEHVPLWYFENLTGRLRFLPNGYTFGVEGQEIDWDGEWVVTTGAGMMFAASICYVFKRLTFQDWTTFNERYASPKVVGQTLAKKGSEPGDAMESIIANFNGDQGIVLYESQPGDKPPISLLGPEGSVSTDMFERFMDRQDRKLTVMFRGSAQANVAAEKKDTGITAQIKETEALELAHCASIMDAFRGITRQVIKYCFGEGVQPLCYFGLPDMDEEDAAQLIASASFLADRGALVEMDTVAERLGVTLTEDPEAALQSTAQPDAEGSRKGAESTANAAKVARLQQLVEQALSTANFDPNEARDEDGKWAKDAPAKQDITPEEREAIASYQDGAYQEINQVLREGGDFEPDEGWRKVIIADLDAAMKRNALPSDAVLYRSGIPEETLAGLKPGDVLADKAYQSTSFSDDASEVGSIHWGKTLAEIRAPKGTPGIFVSGGEKGYDTEQEFLLPRNTALKFAGMSGKRAVFEIAKQ